MLYFSSKHIQYIYVSHKHTHTDMFVLTFQNWVENSCVFYGTVSLQMAVLHKSMVYRVVQFVLILRIQVTHPKRIPQILLTPVYISNVQLKCFNSMFTVIFIEIWLLIVYLYLYLNLCIFIATLLPELIEYMLLIRILYSESVV